MLNWALRILLVVAGFLAGFIVARDDLKFQIVQMVIAVLLFTAGIALASFWPIIKSWFKKK